MFGTRFFGNRFFGGRYWGHVGAAAPTPTPSPVVYGVVYPVSPGYEFFIRTYSRAGVIKNAYIVPLWLRYTNSVDGQEPLVFLLNADHQAVDSLAEYDIVTVYMRHLGLGIHDGNGGFVSDFVGILRRWRQETDDEGITTIEYIVPNEKHILYWRSILYPSGVANRSTFSGVAAETVMKTLVKYNATSLAVTGGASDRYRAGDLVTGMGITIQVATDAGGGNTISISVPGDRLLSALQAVNKIAGGDFYFAWQGGAVWEFDFRTGQLGDDVRTGSNRVIFGLGNNTMSRPRLEWVEAAGTVALAAGQNQGTNRQTSVVEHADYAADHDIELFVDARNEATASGRIARANIHLDDNRARYLLDFQVRQTADVFYSPVAVAGRKVYRAGDLVRAVYGIDASYKIERVAVAWRVSDSDDPCQIDVEVKQIVE